MSVYIPSDKLSFDNLSLQLPEVGLLQNIDIYLSESEKIYFYSENALWPKELLRLIHDPTLRIKGEIKLDKVLLKEKKLTFAQKMDIGFVAKEWPLFFDWTLYDNLKFILDHGQLNLSKLTIDQLLESFHLTDVKDQKLETLSLDHHFLTKYIRAILLNPSLVVISDPLENLKIETIERVAQHLDAYIKERKASAIIAVSNLNQMKGIPARVYHINESGVKTLEV